MTAVDRADLRRDALGVLMPGFTGTTLPVWLAAMLRDGLGGICLFGHNVESPSQVASLTEAIRTANPQAIIATDEEGGDVSRLHQHEGSPFPGNAVLGRIDDLDTTRRVAREVGEQLAAVGIDLTLAPVADINSDPDNPVIGVRSFGADPDVVAAHTAAWVDGVQAAGVGACAKHFPGHGDTAADSHLSEPVVSCDASTLAVREFAPFRAAIAAGTKTIMTSHIRVPALDPATVATFSATVLGDVLRGRLGFEGVVVTDALDMVGASGEIGLPAAAVASVRAGADLLCLGSNNPEREIDAVVDALADAVNDSVLPHHRLADANERCRALAGWLGDRRRDRGTSSAATSPEPLVDRERVAASFTLSDHATDVLAAGGRRVRWVRIDHEPNIAIGETPFGPFFEGGAVPALVVPTDARELANTYEAEADALTVVVGREFHRDAGATAAAAAIGARCTAIVVDMGFAPAGTVDVATFGASRLVGEALLELVGARR